MVPLKDRLLTGMAAIPASCGASPQSANMTRTRILLFPSLRSYHLSSTMPRNMPLIGTVVDESISERPSFHTCTKSSSFVGSPSNEKSWLKFGMLFLPSEVLCEDCPQRTTTLGLSTCCGSTASQMRTSIRPIVFPLVLFLFGLRQFAFTSSLDGGPILFGCGAKSLTTWIVLETTCHRSKTEQTGVGSPHRTLLLFLLLLFSTLLLFEGSQCVFSRDAFFQIGSFF